MLIFGNARGSANPVKPRKRNTHCDSPIFPSHHFNQNVRFPSDGLDPCSRDWGTSKGRPTGVQTILLLSAVLCHFRATLGSMAPTVHFCMTHSIICDTKACAIISKHLDHAGMDGHRSPRGNLMMLDHWDIRSIAWIAAPKYR
jgi:hypothetical protein